MNLGLQEMTKNHECIPVENLYVAVSSFVDCVHDRQLQSKKFWAKIPLEKGVKIACTSGGKRLSRYLLAALIYKMQCFHMFLFLTLNLLNPFSILPLLLQHTFHLDFFLVLQEKKMAELVAANNSIRWSLGPSGTVVSFAEDVGLPNFFNTGPCRYPPPREKCSAPLCSNTYKYRDSKSKVPLCSLECYNVVHAVVST
jgi:hypothetical protein